MAQPVETTTILNAQTFWMLLNQQTDGRTDGRTDSTKCIISLNNGPIWTIQKLAYSGEQALHPDRHCT